MVFFNSFHLEHLDFSRHSKSLETHTNKKTSGATNNPPFHTRNITPRCICIHLPTILWRLLSIETKLLLRHQIKGAPDDNKGFLDSYINEFACKLKNRQN
ncbi:hypothetical protein Csa_005079 [Cucumis sativus]|uniref:Uncharacterized protein n=1 Tax=Cucumis sativus TaxID=3659 RepID=A0A0A0KDY3_CUCSA|nr:hypothetical protein Csa_005079 [Cucumis sativus]